MNSEQVTAAGYLAAWFGSGMATLTASLPFECFVAGCFLGFVMVGVHSRVTRMNSASTIVLSAFIAGSLPPACAALFGLPKDAFLFVAVFSSIAWPFISIRLHDSFFSACNKIINTLPDIIPEVIKKALSKKLGGN